MARTLEKYDYTRGALLIPEGKAFIDKSRILKINILFNEIDAIKLIFAACDSLKYCFVLGDVLHGKVFVRLQLNCTMHMEFAYYAEAAKGTRKDLCYCASADVQKDQNLLKKFRMVLPVCVNCHKKGLEVPRRNPMK